MGFGDRVGVRSDAWVSSAGGEGAGSSSPMTGGRVRSGFPWGGGFPAASPEAAGGSSSCSGTRTAGGASSADPEEGEASAMEDTGYSGST